MLDPHRDHTERLVRPLPRVVEDEVNNDIDLWARTIGLGTRIVSNTFTMDDWDPDDSVTLREGCVSWCTALMWIVPANVSGTWRAGDEDLRIDQQFQRIRVKYGRRTASAATLRGRTIHFAVGDRVYDGRLVNGSMTGTVRSPAGTASWTASRKVTRNLR